MIPLVARLIHAEIKGIKLERCSGVAVKNKNPSLDES
jgi:hypothetical protein